MFRFLSIDWAHHPDLGISGKIFSSCRAWCQFWSKVMMSEVEQRLMLATAGYGRHRSQWIKEVSNKLVVFWKTGRWGEVIAIGGSSVFLNKTKIIWNLQLHISWSGSLFTVSLSKWNLSVRKARQEPKRKHSNSVTRGERCHQYAHLLSHIDNCRYDLTSLQVQQGKVLLVHPSFTPFIYPLIIFIMNREDYQSTCNISR